MRHGLAILILLFFGGAGCFASVGPAQAGTLDLSAHDFYHSSDLALDGEWEFAWKQLLGGDTPIDPHRPVPAFSPVPLRWNKLSGTDDKHLSPFGYATYRLRVKLPSSAPPLALLLQSQASASQLWINGKRVGSMGAIGTSADAEVPQLGHIFYEIPEGTSFLEIRVLISNYAQHRGGFLRPLQLGRADSMRYDETFSQALRFFLAGGLLLMMCYHLILFAYRRKERIHLYFTGIALMAVGRILIPGDHVLQSLLPGLSFAAIVRIEYISLLLIIALISSFLREFYPSRLPHQLERCLWGAAAGFGAFALFAPLPMVTAGQIVTQIINLVGGSLLLFYTAHAWRAGERGAGLLLSSLLVLFAAVINDILHARHVIYTTYLSSYAIFAMVFAQWGLIAQRYSHTFHLLRKQREQFLRSMSIAIESKDPYTGGHVERVACFSRDLALAMGWKAEEAYELYLGAMVHDVGKIGVRDSILNKPGRFDDTELQAMQKHPGIGYHLLTDLEGSSLAAQISLHHQQRWNGSGYTGLSEFPPLSQMDIPLAPRIVAVADYWDAISSDRPYRKAMPLERSIALLIEECGVGLDPDLVRCFLCHDIWMRHLQHPPLPSCVEAANQLIEARWPSREGAC